jgi:hypothetical protein
LIAVDVRSHRRIFFFALRRLASIFLILAFLGIGTGAIEYWHNLDKHSSSHDESNCPTHAILRAPAVLSAAPPVLCHTDAQIDRVVTLSPSLPSQHAPTRIDCRGPPAC